MDEKKHVKFQGRLVFVGFGSIGQGTLPLILRHIDMPRDRITILTADDRGQKEAEEYGIKFVINPIQRDNVEQILGPMLGKGDFLLNLSVDVSSTVLIEYCMQRGVFYLDTCIEPWHGMYTDGSLSLASRSNYGLREEALKLGKKYPKAATIVLTHGANPGLISHWVKQGMVNIARDVAGGDVKIPKTREEWGRFAMKLGVKVIHCAERDTQVAEPRKQRNEFANTWSVDGFVSEGRQPADARDDPGGRDGDVPRAEAEPPRIVERLDRGEHSVEVEKRFTHAHEHDVGEPLAGVGEPSLRVTCLVDDLRDFQVAPEPEFAGGAERASHGTARLAGDAQGVSLPGSSSRRVVHQHRFDERTVREPMECLLRLAVVCEADLAVLDRVEAVGVGDGRPEAFGERSDRRGIRDAAVLPHGIGDLPSAIGRFAARFDPRRECIGRQTGDAGAGVAGHRTMLLPTMAGRPRR